MMRIQRLFFLTLFCSALILPRVSAQKGTLFQADRKASTVAIDSLNELAFRVKNYNLSSAFNILFVSKSLAEKTGYQKGLAVSYLYEASIFQLTGFNKKALSFFDSSYKISSAIRDTFNMARALEQIALYLESKGNTDSAGLIFRKVEMYYAALFKSEKVIDLKIDLGRIEVKKKEFRVAQQYFAEALQSSRTFQYFYGEKKAILNLGIVNTFLNNFTSADSLLGVVWKIESGSGNKSGMAEVQLGLSELHKQQKHFDKGIASALLSYHLADSAKDNQLQQKAINALIDLFLLTGDQANTIKWQDTLIGLKEQQYTEAKQFAFDFINILHDQQLKNQIAEQRISDAADAAKKQEIILIIVGLLFITLAGMAIPVYINYRKARIFGRELSQKNVLIEKNASALDLLNKAISKQNLKLEEENKMKDKLISIISHDLRHPLVNTKSILDMINAKMIDARETEELLGELEGQYIKSLNLLDNLLFWIRNQMKGVPVENVKINIAQLLNSLSEEQRLPGNEKKIQFINNIDPKLELFAEKEMLRIIFRNLLSNAIKFTNIGGRIELSSYVDRGYAYIVVEDNGVGMSQEVLDKVNGLEYFTSEGTANEKGSGFGLILVRDLVAKHNGQLLIQSEPGKGSIFTVKLPLEG